MYKWTNRETYLLSRKNNHPELGVENSARTHKPHYRQENWDGNVVVLVFHNEENNCDSDTSEVVRESGGKGAIVGQTTRIGRTESKEEE